MVLLNVVNISVEFRAVRISDRLLQSTMLRSLGSVVFNVSLGRLRYLLHSVSAVAGSW